MKKVTAVAHSNLAFVKYWGKIDPVLNIPTNNSISMNLSGAKTTTSVEIDQSLPADEYYYNDQPLDLEGNFAKRLNAHINRFREFSRDHLPVRVRTNNSFPDGVGFASSASGFAALTLACSHAFGLEFNEKQLSIWSRQGSGSACRSIPSGFVEWVAGKSNEDSYAKQIAPHTHWDIVDLAVVVSSKEKSVSSTMGHQLATASPFWDARMDSLPKRTNEIREAILEKDFTTFGREVELEAISLHTIAMTSPYTQKDNWFSGIYYWEPETIEVIKAIQEWRGKGLEAYFTLDAGPTVHILCQSKTLEELKKEVIALSGGREWMLIENSPAPGAYIQE